MSHENHQNDIALAKATAQALRNSEAVDSHTAARLAKARQTALAAANGKAQQNIAMLPSVAIAAALLAAVLMLLVQHKNQATPMVATSQDINTLDVLTDDMSPDFYRDLAFYQWLARERPHA